MMQGWKILAQDRQGDSIQQCPAGHIHLDYGNLTLRFHQEEFLAFAAWVGEAAANLSGNPLANLPASKIHPAFSKN